MPSGTNLWSAESTAAGLALVLAAWIVLAAREGSEPWAMVAAVLGAAGTAFAARLIGRTSPLILLLLVASAPLIATAGTGRWPTAAGPLAHPSASGAVFLFAAAAALVAARSTHRSLPRGSLYLLAGVWLFGPLVVGSITTSVGALATVIVLTGAAPPHRQRIVLGVGGVLLVASLAGSVLVGATYEEGGRAGEPAELIGAVAGDHRVAAWHDAVEMIREEPFLGIGAGHFSEVRPPLPDRRAEGAHSEYLRLAAETGLVGGMLLVALVIVVGVALWRGVSSISGPVIVALVALVVDGALADTWRDPVILVVAGALVGVVLARSNRPFPEPDRLSDDARRVVVGSAVLALLVAMPIPPFTGAFTSANDVQWVDETSGIDFAGRGGAISTSPPERLYRDLVSSDAFAVELVLTPRGQQTGPARIVSLSDDQDLRNLTLGQEGDSLVVRLRTTETDWNATRASVEVDGVFLRDEPIHVIVTSDLVETRVYVDGTLRLREQGPGGSLDNWMHRYPLLLGNERTGDRPWAGRLHLVAMYDQSFGPSGVDHLYSHRFDGPEPPSGWSPPSAVALYTFEEASGSVIQDRSARGSGGDINIPSRFPPPPIGPTWNFGTTPVPAVDLIGAWFHFLVLSSWVLVLHGAAKRRFGRSAATKLLVAVLVVVGGVAGVAFAMWPRDDVPEQPDAVVVLGGDGMERAQLGIELHQRHDAALVLSSSAVDFAEGLGVTCAEAICITPVPETTAGEARAVADLTTDQGWDHVTITTSTFHTTRSRVLFRQCLEGRVSVVGAPSVTERGIGTYVRETVGVIAAAVNRAC